MNHNIRDGELSNKGRRLEIQPTAETPHSELKFKTVNNEESVVSGHFQGHFLPFYLEHHQSKLRKTETRQH